MKIETKFNIDDVVFFPAFSVQTEGAIKGITINIYASGRYDIDYEIEEYTFDGELHEAHERSEDVLILK